MNNIKSIFFIATMILFIQCVCGKKVIQIQGIKINDDDSISSSGKIYDIFKSSTECNVLFDLADNKYPYSDTLYFEQNEQIKICIYRDSIFFNNKLILCFQNVATFEQMVYLVSDKHKCLYLYPGLLEDSNGVEEEPDIPLLIRAWHDLGYLIEIDKNNKYIIKNGISYVDPTEFCSLPKIKKFGIENKVCILFDTLR